MQPIPVIRATLPVRSWRGMLVGLQPVDIGRYGRQKLEVEGGASMVSLRRIRPAQLETRSNNPKHVSARNSFRCPNTPLEDVLMLLNSCCSRISTSGVNEHA